MPKKCLLFLSLLGFATGQDVDVGALFGGGGITASGPTSAAAPLGIEACMFCNGRLCLFGEYTHWFTSGGTQGYILEQLNYE